MSEKSTISWCDSTVNFWSGCTQVSAGCKNCYAEARDARMMQEKVIHFGKGAPRLKSVGAVKMALALNRRPWVCDECGHAQEQVNCGGCEKCKDSDVLFHRRRVFSLSLGDWLDDEVPIAWLAEMLDTIRKCDQVTWILCSKRWDNFKTRMGEVLTYIACTSGTSNLLGRWIYSWLIEHNAPKNIPGLCSVEDQPSADARIYDFLRVPLACHGLSLEPLLSAVRLPFFPSGGMANGGVSIGYSGRGGGTINWLIIGGESGPGARPCNVDWIRSLVHQGWAASVPVFVKQLGANPHVTGVWGEPPLTPPLKDKKGGDPAEWPEDLRVQEWPNGF